MSCDNCSRAKSGIWCGYSARCTGCTARALARSMPAFQALHPNGSGDRDDLRDAIQRAMPGTDYATARRMVWDWWLHDHPEAKVYAP